MSRSGRMWEFFNRNVVAIVMIPSIVLIHWGWNKIQDEDIFVKKEEKKDLPVIIGAKKILSSLQEWNGGDKPQSGE